MLLLIYIINYQSGGFGRQFFKKVSVFEKHDIFLGVLGLCTCVRIFKPSPFRRINNGLHSCTIVWELTRKPFGNNDNEITSSVIATETRNTLCFYFRLDFVTSHLWSLFRFVCRRGVSFTNVCRNTIWFRNPHSTPDDFTACIFVRRRGRSFVA